MFSSIFNREKWQILVVRPRSYWKSVYEFNIAEKFQRDAIADVCYQT